MGRGFYRRGCGVRGESSFEEYSALSSDFWERVVCKVRKTPERILLLFQMLRKNRSTRVFDGAGNGTRTRGINLGKVALYH